MSILYGNLVWIGLGAAVIAIALIAALITRRLRSEDLRQERLGRAFERASRVAGAGTGEQGKPYSLYGPRSWEDR